MRYLSIILVCFALARIAGLDLAVMQMQAWAEMIYDRSEQGISQAVLSTFSGASPCEKCNQLEEQRKQQKKNEFCMNSLDKLKFPHASKEKADREVTIETAHNFPLYWVFVSEVYLGVESPPPRV